MPVSCCALVTSTPSCCAGRVAGSHNATPATANLATRRNARQPLPFLVASRQRGEDEQGRFEFAFIVAPLLEEDVTGVRAMNGNVAHGARLIFVGLVVQRQER